MPSFTSKSCLAFLMISAGACTIKTADTSDGGGATPSTTTTTSATGAGTAGSSATGATTTSGTAGSGGSSGTAGSAGSGGSVGDGGITSDGSTVTSDAAVPSDPCNGGIEATPNEDRDHATPYPVGAIAQACLQSVTDVDFYEFTVPSAPAGGYVKIQLTDVGPEGSLDATLYAAHDNGELEGNYNSTSGGSVFFYFAAKPGATFRLKVARFGGVAMPTAYRLTATFNPVPDANEPNDDNAHASALTVGTAVSGYFFAGHEDSTAPAAAAWEDRFKVNLPAGDVTIALSNIASDISGIVTLYNPLGSEIGSKYDSTQGSSVVLKTTVAAADAGDCYLVVAPFSGNKTSGDGSTVPVFYTQAYSLLVTRP